MSMKKLTEQEIQTLAKLIKDIKSICVDRLEAVTADGVELGQAFDQADAILSEKE